MQKGEARLKMSDVFDRRVAPVRGVRYKPHLCGHGVRNTPWKAA